MHAGAVDAVTTLGVGAVEVRPDVVVVELGSQADAADVQVAVREAGEGLGRARAVLLAAGVAATDLRTTTTSTWDDHGHDGTGPRRFVARLGLRARLRGSVLGDLDDAGALVQEALAAAGDTARLDSTRFALADPSRAAAQAREAAFADAQAKAEQLARLAGRALGPVAAVVEGGGESPVPLRAMAARADAFASTLTIDVGEEVVTATVTVRWHWAP